VKTAEVCFGERKKEIYSVSDNESRGGDDDDDDDEYSAVIRL